MPPPKHLETLLEQDDILFRCKQLTDSSLVGFLTKPDTINTLLEYTSQMVTGNVSIDMVPASVAEELRGKGQMDETRLKHLNEKIGSKYPYLVTEIMCSLIGKNYILPKLIENADYSKKFFSVLSTPQGQIDTTGAKQFIRICTTIVHNTELHTGIFTTFYSDDGAPILNLLKFIDYATQQVSDIIKTALLFSPSPNQLHNASNNIFNAQNQRRPSPNNVKNQNQQQQQQQQPTIDFSATKTKIMQQLINEMQSEHSIDTVCGVLQELVVTKRPSPIIDLLVSPESVQSIINLILENKDKPHVCDCAIDLVQKIIYVMQRGDQSVTLIETLLEQFVDILKDNQPSYVQPIHLTTGLLKVPLGLLRLRITQFFAFIFDHLDHLVASQKADSDSDSSPTVDFVSALLRSDVVPVLMQLFFDYPNNNMLHNVVANIIQRIASCERHRSALHQFLSIIISGEKSIIPKLITLYKWNQRLVEQRRPALGHIGHIIIIGYCLSDLDLDEDEMEDRFEGWNDFLQYLKDRNFVENVYRHGDDIPLPQHLVDWEDDDDEEDEFGLKDDTSTGAESQPRSEAEDVDEFASPSTSDDDDDVSVQDLTISDDSTREMTDVQKQRAKLAQLRPATPAVTPSSSQESFNSLASSSSNSGDMHSTEKITAKIAEDLEETTTPQKANPQRGSEEEFEWFLEK